jgi:tetratricopeptide (TPR) repeat protein
VSLNVFISYSHENHAEALRCFRATEMMCAGLGEPYEIFLDSKGDAQLRAGDDWQRKISQALERANVFLVLMSSAYFDSVFCRDVELRRIFERHREDASILVVGIALHGLNPRAFYVEALGRELSMGNYQCLPQGQIETATQGSKLGLKPLSDWPLALREDAWHKVSEQIDEALRHLRSQYVAELPAGQAASQPQAARKPVRLSFWRRLWVVPGTVKPWWVATGVSVLMLLALLLGLSIWAGQVRQDVHESLRLSQPEQAQQSLDKFWIGSLWPGLRDMRELVQAQLMAQDHSADTVKLRQQLDDLLARYPQDADVLYLQALVAFRDVNLNEMSQASAAALQRNPQHAATHALLGNLADVQGDLQAAEQHYRRASSQAPGVPQYAGNLARVLLDLDQPAQALQIYQRLSNYILAPVEQALVYWSQGDLAQAEQSQARALTLLADTSAMALPFNQRGWVFTFLDPRRPEQMTEVSLSVAHRRCYVAYERAISRWLLAADVHAPLPMPEPCQGVEQTGAILDVVDADMCRYIVHRQPTFAAAAQALLHGPLGRRNECAPLLRASAANTANPAGALPAASPASANS